MTDFEFLEDIIRKNSASFYKSFRKLPKEKAQAVFAVYAFCRLLDDTVDLEMSPEALERHRIKFEEVVSGAPQDGRFWKAFAEQYRKYGLEKEPFLLMIQGQLYDLDFREFETKDDLDDYCDLVAGSVGLMLLPILSPLKNREACRVFANKLGRAMQYTNILRDVGEDKGRGRSYLPRSLTAIHAPKQVYRILGEEALSLYRGCLNDIRLFHRDSRFPLILAIFYYRGILIKLFRENFPNEERRVYLDRFEKILTYIKAKIYTLRSWLS